MAVLRVALDEARVLATRCGPWLGGGLVGWVILLRAQRPFVLGHHPFIAPGAAAALGAVLGLLPILWIGTRGDRATDWLLRVSRSPATAVVAGTLALVLVGAALSGLTAVAVACSIFTVSRIPGHGPVGEAWAVLCSAALTLVPVAALAPGLAALPARPRTLTVVWIAVLATSAATGLPIVAGSVLNPQNADSTMGTLGLDALLASALAALGGGLLSLAIARWRHRT